MSREDAQMKIRLAADLRDRIVESAHANNRTLNAEITARLEASYEVEAMAPMQREALNTAIVNMDKVSDLISQMDRLSKAIAQWKEVNGTK